MAGRILKCSICEEVFESAWSEEEALAEKKELWGDVPAEDCDIVCDLCFKRFMAWRALSVKYPSF